MRYATIFVLLMVMFSKFEIYIQSIFKMFNIILIF